MALLLRRGLEREGYAIDVAESGTDALWLATEYDYDVIVLDVMIPKPDGFEVCRTLRAQGRWTPVILLTARETVADRVMGLDVGADDYLVKPFSMAELFARVRALKRREVRERPVILEVGDLVLDPARHEVHRGDMQIPLSAKEFALLEALMQRPGEVLSRAEIINRVWDFAYAGTSNVVDVYIRALRKKIDVPFDRHSIETVRGAGYRLGSA